MKKRKTADEILEQNISGGISVYLRSFGGRQQVLSAIKEHGYQEAEIARQEERVKLMTSMGDHYNEGYEYGQKEERERHAELIGLLRKFELSPVKMLAIAKALNRAGYLEGKGEQK